MNKKLLAKELMKVAHILCASKSAVSTINSASAKIKSVMLDAVKRVVDTKSKLRQILDNISLPENEEKRFDELSKMLDDLNDLLNKEAQE